MPHPALLEIEVRDTTPTLGQPLTAVMSSGDHDDGGAGGWSPQPGSGDPLLRRGGAPTAFFDDSEKSQGEENYGQHQGEPTLVADSYYVLVCLLPGKYICRQRESKRKHSRPITTNTRSVLCVFGSFTISDQSALRVRCCCNSLSSRRPASTASA